MLNKRCADCRHFEVWIPEEGAYVGCGLDYWTMLKKHGPPDFRKFNKKAQGCLEFRYVDS